MAQNRTALLHAQLIPSREVGKGSTSKATWAPLWGSGPRIQENRKKCRATRLVHLIDPPPAAGIHRRSLAAASPPPFQNEKKTERKSSIQAPNRSSLLGCERVLIGLLSEIFTGPLWPMGEEEEKFTWAGILNASVLVVLSPISLLHRRLPTSAAPPPAPPRRRFRRG
jgi:hypothetical protein